MRIAMGEEAAMDSCFILVRTHQHGTAPGKELDVKATAYHQPFTSEALVYSGASV